MNLLRTVGPVALATLCAGLQSCFFTPVYPDPVLERAQQIAHERDEALADCRGDIEGLAGFYRGHMDKSAKEVKAAADCVSARRPSGGSLSECVAHLRKAARLLSKVNGQPESDFSTCGRWETLGEPSCTTAIRQLGETYGATETCVSEKIGKPLAGVCAVDGLSRECVLALDEGTAACMPERDLAACNQVVQKQTQIKQMAADWREDQRTEAMRSQAQAAWAQANATRWASRPTTTNCFDTGAGIRCTTW